MGFPHITTTHNTDIQFATGCKISILRINQASIRKTNAVINTRTMLGEDNSNE